MSRFNLGARRIVKTIYRGFVPSELKITEYVNHEALLKGVLTQRIDIAILSMDSLVAISRDMQVEHLIGVAYKFPIPIKIGIGWSKPSLGERASVLANEFSDKLRRMKTKGQVAVIINQYSNTAYFDDFGSAATSR